MTLFKNGSQVVSMILVLQKRNIPLNTKILLSKVGQIRILFCLSMTQKSIWIISQINRLKLWVNIMHFLQIIFKIKFGVVTIILSLKNLFRVSKTLPKPMLKKINHMLQDTVIQLWRKTALSQFHGLEKIWASTTLCSDMEGTIQKLKKLGKLQCLNYIVKYMMRWLALLQTTFTLTSVTWNLRSAKKPLQKLVP